MHNVGAGWIENSDILVYQMKIFILLLLLLSCYFVDASFWSRSKSPSPPPVTTKQEIDPPLRSLESFNMFQNSGLQVNVDQEMLTALRDLVVSIFFTEKQWKPFFESILTKISFKAPIPGNAEPVEFTKLEILQFSQPKDFEIYLVPQKGIAVKMDHFEIEAKLDYVANSKPGNIRVICKDTFLNGVLVGGITSPPNRPSTSGNDQVIDFAMEEPDFVCHSVLKHVNDGEIGNYLMRQVAKLANLPLVNKIVKNVATTQFKNAMKKVGGKIPLKLISSGINTAFRIVFKTDFKFDDRIDFMNPFIGYSSSTFVVHTGIDIEKRQQLSGKSDMDFKKWFLDEPPSKWESTPDAYGRVILPIDTNAQNPPSRSFLNKLSFGLADTDEMATSRPTKAKTESLKSKFGRLLSGF